MRRFCYICGALLLTSGSIWLLALITVALALIGDGPGELGFQVVVVVSFIGALAALAAGLSLAALAGAGITWVWRRALQG